MNNSTKRARAAAIAVALGATVATLGACTKGGRSDYVQDGDTGAAAPATRPTVNAPGAPDSTAGVSQRTGQRGPAGDTLGSKGKPAGVPASAPAKP